LHSPLSTPFPYTTLFRSNRIAPDFLSGRRHLHDRAQRNGRYHNPVACARMWRSSTRRRRSSRDAGAAGRDAALLDDRTAVDLVLDHLHDNEHRLLRRGMDIRLRPTVEFALQFVWIRTKLIPATVHSQPGIRDRALSSDL